MTDKKYPSDLTDEEWEIIKVILLKLDYQGFFPFTSLDKPSWMRSN